MSGLGDMAEASYTGISSGVRASAAGGEPTEGCAGEDSTACSISVSKGSRYIEHMHKIGPLFPVRVLKSVVLGSNFHHTLLSKPTPKSGYTYDLMWSEHFHVASRAP